MRLSSSPQEDPVIEAIISTLCTSFAERLRKEAAKYPEIEDKMHALALLSLAIRDQVVDTVVTDRHSVLIQKVGQRLAEMRMRRVTLASIIGIHSSYLSRILSEKVPITSAIEAKFLEWLNHREE